MKPATLILLGAAAVGAAVVLGKKRTTTTTGNGRGLGLRRPKKPGVKPPVGVKEGMMDEPVGLGELNPPPMPGALQHFRANMEAAVADCFEGGIEAPNFDAAVLELKICAMSQLFPDNVWPPPQTQPGFHQTWNNMWADVSLDGYVRGALQGGIPG